jgi:hypothetical protein
LDSRWNLRERRVIALRTHIRHRAPPGSMSFIISSNYFPVPEIISANHEIQLNDYPIFTTTYLKFIQENLYHVKLSMLHH